MEASPKPLIFNLFLIDKLVFVSYITHDWFHVPNFHGTTSHDIEKIMEPMKQNGE
jgi:hypothetical protein